MPRQVIPVGIGGIRFHQCAALRAVPVNKDFDIQFPDWLLAAPGASRKPARIIVLNI